GDQRAGKGGRMSTLIRQAIWTRLQEARLVEGALPEAGDTASPWFIRVMLGFAGWLGALFLLGFAGAALPFLFNNAPTMIVVGAAACGASAAIFLAAPKNDFVAQFGLAVSFAGQILLLFGMSQLFRQFGAQEFAWCFLLQEAALFVLVPNFLHRMICALGGALAAIWLITDAGLYAFAPAAISAAFLPAGLSWLDLDRPGPMLRAGGSGLALAAMIAAVLHGELWLAWLVRQGHGTPAGGSAVEWLGRGASALVLLVAVVMLLKREGL